MKTYKLTIAYDGTDYFGWQEQPDKVSVIEALNRAFISAFKKNAHILGASRTDAGVHALGQVARLKTDLEIEPEKMRWVWNNGLPADIIIRSIEVADDSFHPFYNVEQKIYYYHFFTQRPSPFMHRYGWFYHYKIDFDVLREALQFFVGTHDFCAFVCAEDKREDTVRTIDAITLEYFARFGVYRITVVGQKFMRHMIRRIVGASLAVATKGNGSMHLLHEIMKACDPNHALPNAPAQGLMLKKIIYK